MINRCKELILAATMLVGFVMAELPANVKDYTQTSPKYDVETYGGSGLVIVTPESEQDLSS